MEPTASRVLGLVRALTSTAVVLSLAAGAHVLGGGSLPTPAALGALAALVLLVMTVVGRWHLRLWTLVPVLAALQAFLHGALSILPSGAGHGLAGPGMGGHAAAHAHTAPTVVAGGPTTGALTDLAAGPAAHAMPLTASMLVAHAVATLVTAALLVGADRAARAAIHWASSVLPLLLDARSPLVPGRALRGVVAGPVRVRRPLVGLGSLARRGPPAPLATA